MSDTQDNNVSLSKNAEKVMELVENMTVLELSDLVKALEEKFGVTAAAPMMMGAMPTGGDASAEADEEKTEFDVVITEAGAAAIQVTKVVRELVPSLGLMEAKKLVDSAPQTVLEGVKKEVAEEAKSKLEAAGAKVELK